MSKYASWRSSSLSTLLFCTLLVLLSACSSPSNSQGNVHRGAGTPTVRQIASATSQPTAPILQVQTTCPTSGTARAAVMPLMALGTHSAVVYTWNQIDANSQSIAATLRRYDTTTKSKSDILTFPNVRISDAQISADGQWVLFVAQFSDHSAIQLVRVDGHYLQTLYCSYGGAISINALLWSPDQKTIAVNLTAPDLTAPEGRGETIFTLNLDRGAVQTILTGFLSTKTWLDNSHLVAATPVIAQQDQPTLYLVDITKHDQAVQDLQVIRKEQTSCYSVSNSSNPSVLYVSECDSSHPDGPTGPSVIRSVPVSGNLPAGSPATLVVDEVSAILGVFPLDQHNVLYLTKNGLWEVSTDGSRNAKQLTATTNQYIILNSSASTWSNVSRDGTMYAVNLVNGNAQSLSIGSVDGGNPSMFAQSGSNSRDILQIAGWITM